MSETVLEFDQFCSNVLGDITHGVGYEDSYYIVIVFGK